MSHPVPEPAPATPPAPAAAASPAGLPGPGARLAHYELIRELGRGGMGAVYVARDLRLGRRVAIKVMQTTRADLTTRFLVEARATAQCHHENIVVIHDVGQHQKNPYLVLEYLQGTPLSKLMERREPVPAPRAVELVVPVVRALACAHEQGIVHRDLKPDNIFLTDAGTVKVLDFGLAKMAQAAGAGGIPAGFQSFEEIARAAAEAHARGDELHLPLLTQQGAILGTIPYMSPEQWGEGEIDHLTDIWAVGIVLFEMVAGRHPLPQYQGWNLGWEVRALEEPMPSVRTARGDLPDELASAIDHCLQKRKSERMPSARTLLDALEPLMPGRYSRSLRADQPPYPGLATFQEADAGRFFGRAADTAAAVARLHDQPLLGVVGPSGVGKSSFVRAGIVPALKQLEDWAALVIRPGRQPLDTLTHLIAPMLAQAGDHGDTTLLGELHDHRVVRSRLYAEPGILGTVLRSRARARQSKILLVVDQLEELYTLVPDPRERLAFTECLASVADDATAPVRVVVSIRSDFLDRLAEDPRFLAELTRGLYFLREPSREGLHAALVQPADMAGYGFERAAMVEDMLDHVSGVAGALPLLQFAAARLWDRRDRDRRLLTEQGYRALGGIQGALASHADAVIAALSAPAQSLARALFLRLVTRERTRAIVSLRELADLAPQRAELERLLDQLVHARLLVVQGGDGKGAIELVHESLIHTWPRLGRWLDEGHEDSLLLGELREAARQWEAHGRHHDLLWRGEPLAAARHRAARFQRSLSPLEHAFLEAAFRQAARMARARRLALGSIITLLSLLLAAAAVALVLIRAAQGEAETQAAVARRAEAQVREQLARVQAEERARRAAEERERAARQAVERANDQVELTNEQLARKNAELRDALARATEAGERARAARARAEHNEAAALAAEADARRANERLQRLLARERERVRRLESEGASLVHDLPRSSSAAGDAPGAERRPQ